MEWIKQHSLVTLLCLYALAVNLSTFVQYGWDKHQARQQKRRVPEKRLHLLALAGGTPGAFLGQIAFRHKTQKRSFQVVFVGTVMVQILVVSAILYLKYWR